MLLIKKICFFFSEAYLNHWEAKNRQCLFFIWRHFFSCSWYEHLLVAIKDTHSHMITNILGHLKNSKHVLSFQRFFYYFFLSLAGVCKHVGALLYHISSEVREGNWHCSVSKIQINYNSDVIYNTKITYNTKNTTNPTWQAIPKLFSMLTPFQY